VLGNRKHHSVRGVISVTRDTCALVWTWTVINEGGFKNFAIQIFPDAKLFEIFNTVELHDRRLLRSRSRGSGRVGRTSTGVAVERGDQLGELASLGKSED
jgi:uncharacterized protein YpbB